METEMIIMLLMMIAILFLVDYVSTQKRIDEINEEIKRVEEEMEKEE